jgi:hypothetical protein
MSSEIQNRVQENGKMECIVCDLELKDMDHWEKHMKSLVHKENLKNYATKDKKPLTEKTPGENVPAKSAPKEDEFEAPAPRKPKVEVEEETTVGVQIVNEPANDSILPQVFIYKKLGFL